MNAVAASHPANALRFPAHGALSGTSLKHQHLDAIRADTGHRGFFEVHAENYMGAGGMPHRVLESIRRDYPLSVHGVCMSIGGEQPLDAAHLERFCTLVKRYEPVLISEHLAWSTHGAQFFNDLLPLPYTNNTLARVCRHIDQVQNAIGRKLLLENPATYVAFAETTMRETDFLRTIAHKTGCGLLLDINNVFVSANNHGYAPQEYLASFPLGAVGEIHLAGHKAQCDDDGAPLLIDSHDAPVAGTVWALYKDVIARTGLVPTLIEWDGNIPAWDVLKNEAAAAQGILDSHGAKTIRHAC